MVLGCLIPPIQRHLLDCISAHTASQPPAERHTHTGQNCTDHDIDIVSLGTDAGASQGGGKGVPGPAQRCTHTKSGVCSVHGPGAKWCWEPVPVGKRKMGQNGKLMTKRYFWKCEVGRNGKVLRQTRISFLRSVGDESLGDNNAGSRRRTISEGQ